ncbi:MAG TPA: efflux RND transporter periplasmic adaptor subunit [Sporichthyaceae bacterium]|jgi:RND family efflux transporter MFP subunit
MLRAEKREQAAPGAMAIGRSPRGLFRRRKALIGAVVVITAAGGTGAWAMTRGGGSAAAGNTARSLVETISSQPIEQTVNASGTIEPAKVADESFAVSGQITSVKVAVGDTVTKGQVLARVNDDDLARALDIAQANRDSAAAQVTSAEDAAASDTQIASAKAQLATADDKLAQAQDDVDNATLKATIAGTVASVSIAKGDRISGGSSGGAAKSGSGSSSAQIEIVGTTTWEVDASVSGTDLSSIQKDQQARITPSGASQAIFGTVSSVGVVASTASGGSSSFPVTIKITGTPTDLHPGETATVVIVTKSVPDVLTVPTAALRQENGQTVVTKVVDGKDSTVPVVVGTAYGASTQVTSGLSEGDQVRVTVNRAGPATGNNNRTGNRTGGAGGFGGGTFTGGAGGGTFTGGTFTGGTRGGN